MKHVARNFPAWSPETDDVIVKELARKHVAFVDADKVVVGRAPQPSRTHFPVMDPITM